MLLVADIEAPPLGEGNVALIVGEELLHCKPSSHVCYIIALGSLVHSDDFMMPLSIMSIATTQHMFVK